MVSRFPACLALVSTLTLAALPEIACHLSTRHPLSSFRAHPDTTTGAPVSDPACWRGTLDRAGSETGAPVAVIRRALSTRPKPANSFEHFRIFYLRHFDE